MPDAAPGGAAGVWPGRSLVLLVFGLAGSLVVLWKKKYGNRG